MSLSSTSLSSSPSLPFGSSLISITLNGEAFALKSCTIMQLLEARQLSGKRVAVERNGSIVPKSQHGSTRIEADDRIEIVVAVGGG